MKKLTIHSEAAYFLGLVILAIGTAMMEAADFGMSMVVGPAYILHLKISQTIPAFTFGTAAYTFEAALLILMCLVLRRFKVSYLFSFVTAVLYGCILDVVMLLFRPVSCDTTAARLVFYLAGMVIGAAGIAFLFHTYISPEVYELIVKEVSKRTGKPIPVIKTIYDCCSCLLGVALSFCFFGLWHFEGVKWGTVVCALVNGYLIGLFTRLYHKVFEFRDGLRLRAFFER